MAGGIRWERIEGYLPAQQAPASRFFPDGMVFRGVNINGVVQELFNLVRATAPPKGSTFI